MNHSLFPPHTRLCVVTSLKLDVAQFGEAAHHDGSDRRTASGNEVGLYRRRREVLARPERAGARAKSEKADGAVKRSTIQFVATGNSQFWSHLNLISISGTYLEQKTPPRLRLRFSCGKSFHDSFCSLYEYVPFFPRRAAPLSLSLSLLHCLLTARAAARAPRPPFSAAPPRRPLESAAPWRSPWPRR